MLVLPFLKQLLKSRNFVNTVMKMNVLWQKSNGHIGKIDFTGCLKK